jgi:molecular chaperone DnaK (HSP70)
MTEYIIEQETCERRKRMAIVIGLDFGNFNSYPSYIEDLDAEHDRLGGRAVDLIPPNSWQGIPSVFFYNGKGGFLTGRAAVTGAAKPERNRIRYLKRSLGEPLLIDDKPVVINGKTWLYDDAIREVIQSVLREANRELQHIAREMTDLVALSYPATYSSPERERLIEIVKSATLEDGRHFHVVGTIAEPAAAALDYLALRNLTEDTTVLVFDLGGGTFDLSLVSCYPKGKQRADGNTAYYDVHMTDGLPRTGGREFDEVIYSLLLDKLSAFLRKNKLSLTKYLDEKLHQDAETVKRELTETDRTVYEIYIPALEDTIPFELTRAEFEQAPRVREMLKQMTDKAHLLLSSPGIPRPERIVLTGGSSRMPMIRRALSEALPEYAGIIDGILEYKPETAISYGAARYGIPEKGSGITAADPKRPIKIKGRDGVKVHLSYDVGLRYFRGAADEKGYIDCMLAHGTELPAESEWSIGNKLYEGREATKKLYEARVKSPDYNEPERDYRFIKSVTVDFGTSVPVGTTSETRLVVDENGLVTMQARRNSHSPLFHIRAVLTTDFK